MKRALRTGISALMLGFLLQGATLQYLSLEDMVGKSTAIVRAKVIGSYAAAGRTVIYTHYKLQVLDAWKGSEGSEAEVVLPGGSANGVRMTFPGSPQLAAGKEYVLFLWTGPSGMTHLTGSSQGLFSVARDANGQITASRAPAGDVMLGTSGAPVRDSGLTMRLGDFRTRVMAIAQGANR